MTFQSSVSPAKTSKRGDSIWVVITLFHAKKEVGGFTQSVTSTKRKPMDEYSERKE